MLLFQVIANHPGVLPPGTSQSMHMAGCGKSRNRTLQAWYPCHQISQSPNKQLPTIHLTISQHLHKSHSPYLHLPHSPCPAPCAASSPRASAPAPPSHPQLDLSSAPKVQLAASRPASRVRTPSRGRIRSRCGRLWLLRCWARGRIS